MARIRTYKDIHSLPLPFRELLVSVFTLVSAGMVFFLAGKPVGDYANYYYGSRFFMEGVKVSDIYDPASFNSLIAVSGSRGIFADYAPVPPFTLLFYAPFALVDIFTSKILFNLFSLLVFLLSFYRFVVFRNIPLSAIASALLIILFPLYSNILLGQSYLIVLALLMEGYMFLTKGKSVWAALCFSIPIALKIFPAILLLWLFLSDKKKELALTLLFSVLLFASVIPFTGIALVNEYLGSILPRLMQGEINDPFSISYQSMTVFLRRLFIFDAHLNPGSFTDAFIPFAILNALFTAFFLNACIQLTIKYRGVPAFTFGLTLFAGFLISGYGTTYSLVMLLLIWISLEERGNWDAYKKPFCLLLFVLVTYFPVSGIDVLPVTLQFGRMYAMLLLFFLIYPVKEVRIFNLYYPALLFMLLVPVFFSFSGIKDKSSYYLDKEPSLLITDYRPDEGGIRVRYIGRNGYDSLLYKTKDRICRTGKLSLKNNQIYFAGRQVSFGKDIKKEPLMLLNGNEVLYLSDMGRGVGLTTVRKISLENRSK